MKHAIFLHFCGILLLQCIHRYNAEGIGIEDCGGVSFVARLNNSVEFVFSSLIDQKSRGFSVEFIFEKPVENFQASENSTKVIIATELSSTHWVVSVPKTRVSDTKRAEFTARYIDPGKSLLNAIIVNAIDTVCGDGKSKVFTADNLKYDGMMACNVTRTLYEHASSLIIEENFHSERVGLVIDIYLDSDIDNFEVWNTIGRLIGKRHVSLANSGFISSVDKPVKANVRLEHKGKPPPNVVALVINDVTICGFAPTLQVLREDGALGVISESLSTSQSSIESLEHLNIFLSVVSAGSIVMAVATGIFAWKLIR